MWKAAIVVVGLAVAGCSATVTHRLDTADTDATGIRYYDSAPYLIVYSDGMGGLKWQIRYLPDQSRLMTATPKIIGGRTEMTLYFQNGVLASASTVGDTTELPKALIGAIQSALPLLAGVAEGPANPKGFPAPYLYKIVVNGDSASFTGNSVSFIGQQGKTRIQVPLPSGQPQS
jgi:hypothetical protein